MKKSAYLLLIVLLSFSCTKEPKQTEENVTTLMSLKSNEVQDQHIRKVQSVEAPPALRSSDVSIATVQGSDDMNGKDIADIKEVVTAENGEPVVVPDKVKSEVIKNKIIKDGRLGLQVTNLEVAKKQIDSLVKSTGGYYANENLKNSDNQSGYELVIRIPVVNFERFVSFAEKGSAKVLYKEIQARDVTEEFVDLNTRINSKRNSLTRYNEIMKKANSVKDIIEIEESIRVLQEEIESSEGRLRYLNSCVDYSTLNMTISTEKDFTFKPAKRDSFWEKLKESVADGWYGLVDFILEFFGSWPYLILIIPGVLFIWRWIKRRRARKQKE
ncbi:MAG: DUF4349 domain-containing protein [Paludibacter sp.]|nr:DUF4349 domain-containing protein [Paludibacter sp.]